MSEKEGVLYELNHKLILAYIYGAKHVNVPNISALQISGKHWIQNCAKRSGDFFHGRHVTLTNQPF